MVVICGESLRVCCGCVDKGGDVWFLGVLISVLMLFIRPPKKDVLGLEASTAEVDDSGGALDEE